jgi:hypothetical protein
MRTGLSRSYIYSSDQLADSVVTNTKIADNAITTLKIDGSSIYPFHLGTQIKSSRAKAYRSTDQSYNAATDTKVQFNTKVFDPLYHYDNTTNYRYTVGYGYDGQFVVHAQVQVAAHSSAGGIAIYIEKNGEIVARKVVNYQSSALGFTVDITCVIDLVAGDYIEIFINDTLAGTITGGSDKTFFEIFRLP